MNLIFYYILARQKKLANNSYVIKDDFFSKNFTNSNNKYYLTYVNYHNTNYLLYSYYEVCYYLKEVALVRKKQIT